MTARRITLDDITNGDYHTQEGFNPNYIITPRGIKASRLSTIATVVDTFINDDESYGALTLDDGTDTLRAKYFQELDAMEDIEEGDIIETIGKVREYDDELYIQPEHTIKRTMKHELLHTLEVEHLRRRWQEAVETAQQMQDEGKSEQDIIEELKGHGLEPDDAEAVLTYIDPDEQFSTGDDIETTQEPQSPEEETRATMQQQDQDEQEEHEEQIVLGLIEQLDEGDGAEYNDIIDQSDLSEERIESVINDLLSDGTCYEPKPGRIKKL
ncbi:MAG: hypothetical protein MUP66_02985 [Candidatus Nanohaloarchaeota archaeon QJJ-5]|nr:hypothetical protein [Candidatus Nanohaloarchaeota archaeon QJJ-5]